MSKRGFSEQKEISLVDTKENNEQMCECMKMLPFTVLRFSQKKEIHAGNAV